MQKAGKTNEVKLDNKERSPLNTPYSPAAPEINDPVFTFCSATSLFVGQSQLASPLSTAKQTGKQPEKD